MNEILNLFSPTCIKKLKDTNVLKWAQNQKLVKLNKNLEKAINTRFIGPPQEHDLWFLQKNNISTVQFSLCF